MTAPASFVIERIAPAAANYLRRLPQHQQQAIAQAFDHLCQISPFHHSNPTAIKPLRCVLIMPTSKSNCTFCKIIRGELSSHLVFEDDIALAFLDHRPVFPGHCLLVPKAHHETLADLPADLLAPLFADAQLLARAVEQGLPAEGTFVAINNRVSQSVPHLHIHVVPRRKKDGLKGFFWPRQPYKNNAEILETKNLLKATIAQLQKA